MFRASWLELQIVKVCRMPDAWVRLLRPSHDLTLPRRDPGLLQQPALCELLLLGADPPSPSPAGISVNSLACSMDPSKLQWREISSVLHTV